MGRDACVVWSRHPDLPSFTARVLVDAANEFFLAIDLDEAETIRAGEPVMRRLTVDLVPLAVSTGCDAVDCLCKARMAAAGRATPQASVPFLLGACPERTLLRDVRNATRMLDVNLGPEARWSHPKLTEFPEVLAMTLDVARGAALAAGEPQHPVLVLLGQMFPGGRAPVFLFFEADRLVLEAPGLLPSGLVATHAPLPRPGTRLN